MATFQLWKREISVGICFFTATSPVTAMQQVAWGNPLRSTLDLPRVRTLVQPQQGSSFARTTVVLQRAGQRRSSRC